jgi:hypothetical protein
MSTKVLSNQRVTVLAGLSSAIADWTEPSLSNLAALTNVSGAVNWNSFDLNIQASEQNDDRTLTDGAGAQSRGFTNFGGGLQFVNPRVDDLASIYRTAYNIFSNLRVELVVAVRYGKKNAMVPAAGDKWTIYRLMTDAVVFGQGDVSKYYGVDLIARDDILPNYIVPAASPAIITVTMLSATAAVGALVFASAQYQGWDVTKAVTWVSSDETKLIEVHPGIFKALASGAATITAKYPGGLDSTASSVAIS